MAGEVDGARGGNFEKLMANRDRLSSVQTNMVERAPKEQREFLTAQFQLENESQVTDMISKLLKEDTRMAILRNLA
jgi:hypothetical protein